LLHDKSHITWAYVAGFFDGEGSVLKDRRGGDRWITFAVVFYQSNRLVLDKIAEFFAEAAIPCRVYSYRSSRDREAFALRVCGKENVFNVLDGMGPFLIVKRDKAGEAVDYILNTVNNGVLTIAA
jgi:hypothetical protein